MALGQVVGGGDTGVIVGGLVPRLDIGRIDAVRHIDDDDILLARLLDHLIQASGRDRHDQHRVSALGDAVLDLGDLFR